MEVKSSVALRISPTSRTYTFSAKKLPRITQIFTDALKGERVKCVHDFATNL